MSVAVGAVDQGTTSTRALRMEADGRARIVYAKRHAQHYPRAGWVEHNPLELLANVNEAVLALGKVAAIGLANQGESCLAWDARDGRPITPVIVWQDERTRDVIEELRKKGAEPIVRAKTGLPLDPYFSAAKLGHIVRAFPEARELLAAGHLSLGTTDAFFLHHLTGRAVSDVTTASRTSLMHLADCAFDDELCALFGVPPDAMAPIVPTTGDYGTVGPHEVPLTASIVDQQAALYGHGCRAAGETKITIGTGAFVQQVIGPNVPQETSGALPTLALQRDGEAPVYALDGGVYAAGAAVEWARRLGLFAELAELNAFDGPPALSRGLAFVPALAGLGCPHWDRGARGAYLGLGIGAEREDLCRALIEGIVLRCAEVIAAMPEPCGAISVDGGLSANPFLVEFLSAVLARPVRLPTGTELTAEGAARLAADAAGVAITSSAPGRVVEARQDLSHLLPRYREAVHLARRWQVPAEDGANHQM